MTDPAPHLLITRTHAAAQALLTALAVAGAEPEATVSPLFDIVPQGAVPDLRDVVGVVLTSASAITAHPGLIVPPGQVAYCVGDHTAATARAAGFVARSATGDAGALVAMILADPPHGRLVHLRGTHSRGDVAARLTAAGVPCAERIVYCQAAQPLNEVARTVLAGAVRVIVPMFSPRSAAIFADQGPFAAPLHVVAISAATADAAAPLRPETMTIAAEPDATAMRNAVIAALRVAR